MFLPENSVMKTIDIPTDDPLKMIWAVREKIHDETKNMSTEQWSDYLREANERVLAKMARIRAEEQEGVAAGKKVKKAWE